MFGRWHYHNKLWLIILWGDFEVLNLWESSRENQNKGSRDYETSNSKITTDLLEYYFKSSKLWKIDVNLVEQKMKMG